MSPVLGINAGMVPVATGIGRRIGEENLVAPDPHLDVAIGHGLQRGDELLHELRQRDEPERGQDAP